MAWSLTRQIPRAQRRRIVGNNPDLGWFGDLKPCVPPLDQIPVASLLLHIFAEPFRPDPKAQAVEPLIHLFEAATAHREAVLGRGGARSQ
jgi:hypothetical protein